MAAPAPVPTRVLALALRNLAPMSDDRNELVKISPGGGSVRGPGNMSGLFGFWFSPAVRRTIWRRGFEDSGRGQAVDRPPPSDVGSIHANSIVFRPLVSHAEYLP